MINDSPNARSPSRRRRLVVVAGCAGVLAVLGSFGFAMWYTWIRPVHAHRQIYDKVEALIESLADKRPPGVSQRRWSFFLGWTMNAIGNCCSLRQHIKDDPESHERFHLFADELERRIDAGEINMDLIDWIWDELEQFSKNGKIYSDKFRPTTPERLKEADQIPVGNHGPLVR